MSRYLDEKEQMMRCWLRAVWRQHRRNVSQAARYLGISREYMQRLVKRYELR